MLAKLTKGQWKLKKQLGEWVTSHENWERKHTWHMDSRMKHLYERHGRQWIKYKRMERARQYYTYNRNQKEIVRNAPGTVPVDIKDEARMSDTGRKIRNSRNNKCSYIHFHKI